MSQLVCAHTKAGDRQIKDSGSGLGGPRLVRENEVVEVLKQAIVSKDLTKTRARSDDGIRDDAYFVASVQRPKAVFDAWNKIGRYLYLHRLPSMNHPIKTRCSFDSKVSKALSKPVCHTWRVVLHLPMVSEGGLSVLEASDCGIASHLRLMGQDFIYERRQADVCLGFQALGSTPGLIRVVIDDGIPEIKRDPADGH
jgi:hypothetical protein